MRRKRIDDNVGEGIATHAHTIPISLNYKLLFVLRLNNRHFSNTAWLFF